MDPFLALPKLALVLTLTRISFFKQFFTADQLQRIAFSEICRNDTVHHSKVLFEIAVKASTTLSSDVR